MMFGGRLDSVALDFAKVAALSPATKQRAMQARMVVDGGKLFAVINGKPT